MIKQGLYNDSILEKKFKILRMSILLGNISNKDETLTKYEETALEIDKIRRGMYEEKIASRQYTTTSLEEEEKRLSELIGLVEERVNERNAFIDDYIRVTSNYLDDLPRVKEEDLLVDYKIRLDNIHEFLSNCDEINRLNDKLYELRNELEEKYENKANSEIINSKLEDELIEEFNRYITRDSYYANLNYVDIDEELNKIDAALADKYDVMNTFISSYDALRNAGISGVEREEYLSYVRDSKLDYYNELEKKYVLNIYKLVLDKENDYDRLYEKRLYIEKLLNNRENDRVNLEVTIRDDLVYFKDLCREQFSVIKSQKFNIDNIDKLISEISDCERKLEDLQAANNRKEIVDLINEFSEEAPKSAKIDLPDPVEIKEEVFENEMAPEVNDKVIPKAPNMVVKISDPIKMNVKRATDTAKLVMKKVVIVLEPKKFNNKKDKIKEAEQELMLEKAIDALNEEKHEEEKTEEIVNEEETQEEETTKEEPIDNDIFVHYTDTEENEDNKENDAIEDNLFLENLTVNSDSKEENGLNISTDIFVAGNESDDKKPAELFSETDPFLDDNEFEKNEASKTEEFINGVPLVGNIGTVKPTNVLTQIENATQTSNDIILPTMGFTNNPKVGVPIVSENYIKETQDSK